MSEKKRFTLTEEDLISSETDDSSGDEMEDLPPSYSSIFDEIAANSPLRVPEDDEMHPAAFESKDDWNIPSTLLKSFLEIR